MKMAYRKAGLSARGGLMILAACDEMTLELGSFASIRVESSRGMGNLTAAESSPRRSTPRSCYQWSRAWNALGERTSSLMVDGKMNEGRP
jgi:hypothetical protein